MRKTLFGCFEGMCHVYEEEKEDFEKYRKFHNEIPKEKVIAHIESLGPGLTSGISRDMFTGEKLYPGIYDDGNFIFPLEFLHYYKNYDIGIPYEYEAYLKELFEAEEG